MAEDLKAAARQYFGMGLPVIPEKIWFSQEDNEWKKIPLCEWKLWQTKKQTQEEFESLNWNEANGFAILAGSKTNDGLFFGCVDFDSKKVSQEAIEKGKEVIKNLPTTRMEETVSKGLHLNYLSRKKPRSIKAYHDIAAVELISENCLVVMAPSQGYKALNDNSLTIVEDLETLFFQALEKTGVNVEKPQAVWFDSAELSGKPYRGKDPPCIQALLKGTHEGLRNEYGIRLGSYFINFKQYQPKTVREEILKAWNKLNSPELSWKELDSLVKSAVQGKYVYGCTDPILKSQCDREKCPIAPKQTAKLLTPEERERAEMLLADPMLLDYVVQFGRRRLIGEDNTLLTNFVIVCSGQTKYPISGILSGFSGSGKNESLRAVKPLIPAEWLFEFTTSTPEAVKYIPEEFAGTLLIYEMAGMESRTGTLGLRSVGEGESIETIFPMRDEETGNMMLGRHKTNAKNFITTESDIGIHADLYRRVLKLSLNHSDILTKRVLAKQLRDAMLPEGLRKKLGLDIGAKMPYSEKDFQNALRLVDWNVEVVVFPPASLLQLEKLAIKKEQKVALRSQIERILNFIRVLAIIHQRQRIIIEDKEDDSKFVVASAEDFESAMKILAPSIIETVSRLEKRQNEALELIESSNEELWDKNKLAQKLGVSTVTAARILKTLANLGYLREIQTSKPYSYELIQDREKPKQLVLLEEINNYKAFYEKELETFLTHTLSPYQNLHVRGISPINVDKPTKRPEPEKYPLPSEERQGEKVPTESVPSLSEQNNPELLFNSERISENKLIVNDEDSATPTPSQSGEKVRSVERSKEKVSNGEIKPEEQISQPMRSDLSQFDIDKLEPLTVLSDFKNEHCVKCGLRDVAWQVTLKDGSLGFLCKKCGAELSKDKVESQRQQQNWILKVEGNKVYAKDGNILFQCPYCKSTYFVSETELEQHIRAFHAGR